MIREVKFRAFDVINEKIVKVDSVDFIHNQLHFLNETFKGNPTFITDYKLMQYTGLNDKNDVEIYEGDIVGHNDFVGYVKYINSGNCNILGYALISVINSRIFYMYCDEADKYEVIGNIYENKELLK